MGIKVARLISGETVIGIECETGIESVLLLTSISQTKMNRAEDGQVKVETGNFVVFINSYMHPYSADVCISIPHNIIITLVEPSPLVLGLYQRHQPCPPGLKLIKGKPSLN